MSVPPRAGEGLGGGRHPPMQPGWIDAPHHHVALGDLRLESGESIRDCTVSYVVHGAQRAPGVPADGVPVVLALSAIASHHHRLDFLIGPGRALDVSRFAIVAIDALGNGLATSPSTSVAQPDTAFPRFSIRDMVASQAAVLDAIGVGRLHAVAGASMGGMQALQWAVSHPARVGRVVAMTPMARTTAWAAAINECSRRALAAGGPGGPGGPGSPGSTGTGRGPVSSWAADGPARASMHGRSRPRAPVARKRGRSPFHTPQQQALDVIALQHQEQ